MVMIGGIIGDDIQDNVNKIPLLGDLPVLGYLFKKESQKVSRVNLYIFLTPRIIRNPMEAGNITGEKKEHALMKQGEGAEKFRFKEDTQAILKSRHMPPTMREDVPNTPGEEQPEPQQQEEQQPQEQQQQP